MNINNKAVFLTLLMIAAVLSSCKKVDEEAVPVMLAVTAETTTASVTTTAATEPPEHYETVSFTAVGDNLIHSSIYQQAYERAPGEDYDFSKAYMRVRNLIEPADIAIINQETLICNDLFKPSTYPCFNSPTQLGNCMLDLGFDVFTIANNHTLDKDTDGLSACLDYWNSKDNAVVAGAYRNKFDKDNIRTNEVKGITFSYLSYTESLNGLSLPADSEFIIGDANDIDGMVEDIKKASDISDVCVVSMHWGVENSDVISDYQRQTAQLLVDAGADIIIGNHPHVLRDIEMIKREDGTEALCAYSLGNFISAQSIGQNLIGGVLDFDVKLLISGNGEILDKQPAIENIKLIPIVTQYYSGYSDISIYPLYDYTPELAEVHGVKEYSKFSYDYIFEILEKNIDEKYLVLPTKKQPANLTT